MGTLLHDDLLAPEVIANPYLVQLREFILPLFF